MRLEIMTLLGGAIMLGVSLAVWRAYVDFLHRQREACRVFLDLLRDLRDKTYCYLESAREWASRTARRDAYGFTDMVGSGVGLLEAYEACRESLYLPREADEALVEYFTRAGGGYLDGELMAADRAIERLAALDAASGEETARRTRVAGALLGALAAGIVIMIL